MNAIKVLAIGLPLALAACGPSKEQRLAAFAARCDQAGFTRPQCLMLFEIREKAEADAAAASAIGGVAIGLSAAPK